MNKDIKRSRARFVVTGTVQGVGFRPFVYRIAVREGLGGFVWNDSRGVTAEVEGAKSQVERFAKALRDELPPLASVLTLSREEIEPLGERDFRIEKSRVLETRTAVVTPDSATCAECLAEMLDPADRRRLYPFINCTNCGPRYSIIEDVPYDRPKTTMKSFTMCPDCRAEYDDPASRRFHAQPNACPVCGPRLAVADAAGRDIEVDDAVAYTREKLKLGKVAAIKGLGGFHLAVDAGKDDAVKRLRSLKHREEKALAIMVKDLEGARRIAEVTPAAEEILQGVQRPIVLLEKKAGTKIAASVAPRSKYFGIMLPYTPLHHLLLDGPYEALVMTSGNVSEEPIARDNAEAVSRLGGIADFFLLHDRDIHVRVEDSVVTVFEEKLYPVRRSRGWAPFPVIMKTPSPVEILAVGGELKTALTLLKGDRAYVSQHIGDLRNDLAYRNFRESIDELQRLLEVKPQLVAADLHPQYLSRRYARSLGLPVIEVQHHHAHTASVMAECGLDGRVIGLSCDGAGYGQDKAVWGCEVLDVSLADYRRMGHLRYVALPGGDAAVKDADRSAYTHLLAAFESDEEIPLVEVLSRLGDRKRGLLKDMIEKNVNSPLTSSLGRLFDAAAAISGVAHRTTYEGQPAIEFEAVAARGVEDSYPWKVEETGDGLIIDPRGIVRAVAGETLAGVDRGVVAARFHNAVAEFLVEACRRARDSAGLGQVALSGGVFQNMYLLKRLCRLLRGDGFKVYVHSQVPTNDGGISLGQAAVAAERARLGLVNLE